MAAKKKSNPRAAQDRKDKRLAQDAHRAGMTREEYISILVKQIDRIAKEELWRPSERAAACADVMLMADDVFGKVP